MLIALDLTTFTPDYLVSLANLISDAMETNYEAGLPLVSMEKAFEVVCQQLDTLIGKDFRTENVFVPRLEKMK
jgi:hypothetical protein